MNAHAMNWHYNKNPEKTEEPNYINTGHGADRSEKGNPSSGPETSATYVNTGPGADRDTVAFPAPETPATYVNTGLQVLTGPRKANPAVSRKRRRMMPYQIIGHYTIIRMVMLAILMPVQIMS